MNPWYFNSFIPSKRANVQNWDAPELSLSLGNVLNQRIYTDSGQVIVQQGSYAGFTWNNRNGTGTYVYRLIALKIISWVSLRFPNLQNTNPIRLDGIL